MPSGKELLNGRRADLIVLTLLALGFDTHSILGLRVLGGFEARQRYVGLKDPVRLVVAVPGIDGANEREAIQHRGLFRQMLTDAHAR